MYSKKSKQKKFVGGGILAAQIALEAGKGLYGAYQTQQAQRELSKLKPVGATVGGGVGNFGYTISGVSKSSTNLFNSS